ncbi:MAG: DUF1295 domain-containing protein [Coriobacteriia bacterium]|nr:DUF1295 domain-containing protein [Coriobacteriia bacterium]
MASVAFTRTDVADVAWGLGFVVLAWWGALLVPAVPSARGILAAVLVSVWGVRLAVHIARRGFRAGGREDARYAAMREGASGSWALRSLPVVFWLQGALMGLVAAPLTVMAAAPSVPLDVADLVAVAVFVGGFLLEATADVQLGRWLADPSHKGRPLVTGVWAWSRHPNHAGDAIAWWGLGLLALPVAGGALALLGPLAMTLLLRYVSGVPLLEKRHIGEEEWDAYRARTSIFWPAPPRAR